MTYMGIMHPPTTSYLTSRTPHNIPMTAATSTTPSTKLYWIPPQHATSSMTNGGLPSCRLAPRNTHPAQALLPRSYGRDRDGRSCERLPFGRWEVSNVILSHLGHGRRNYSNVCISNDEPNSGLLLAPLRKHYRIIQREPTECRSWKRQTMANQRASWSCWCGMQTLVSAQLFFESGTRVRPWSRS